MLVGTKNEESGLAREFEEVYTRCIDTRPLFVEALPAKTCAAGHIGHLFFAGGPHLANLLGAEEGRAYESPQKQIAGIGSTLC